MNMNGTRMFQINIVLISSYMYIKLPSPTIDWTTFMYLNKISALLHKTCFLTLACQKVPIREITNLSKYTIFISFDILLFML